MDRADGADRKDRGTRKGKNRFLKFLGYKSRFFYEESKILICKLIQVSILIVLDKGLLIRYGFGKR